MSLHDLHHGFLESAAVSHPSEPKRAFRGTEECSHALLRTSDDGLIRCKHSMCLDVLDALSMFKHRDVPPSP